MFGKKLVIFREGGGGGTPFTENSAKIINLIIEPFPKTGQKYLRGIFNSTRFFHFCKTERNISFHFHTAATEKDPDTENARREVHMKTENYEKDILENFLELMVNVNEYQPIFDIYK